MPHVFVTTVVTLTDYCVAKSSRTRVAASLEAGE